MNIFKNKRNSMLALIFTTFIVFVSFQNCSQSGFISTTESQQNSLSSTSTDPQPAVANPPTSEPVPILPPPLSSTFITKISTTNGVRCAVFGPTQKVRCYGLGTYSGFEVTDQNKFVEIKDSEGAIQVANAQYFACALMKNKTVKCWGSNPYGQLGNGTIENSNTASQVLNLTNVKKISLGSYFACALKEDQTVWCWGRNDGSVMITGHSEYQILNAVQASGLENVIDINSGSYHSCAILATHQIKCWGESGSGQLGNNSTVKSLDPVIVSGVENALQVGASKGTSFTCALLNTGKVNCWGDNRYGQLGNGSLDSSLIPLEVSGLENIKAITVGTFSSCAINQLNEVKCWGGDYGKTPYYIDQISDYYEMDFDRNLSVLTKTGLVVSYSGLTNNKYNLFGF